VGSIIEEKGSRREERASTNGEKFEKCKKEIVRSELKSSK
jgi:hypothetical protein